MKNDNRGFTLLELIAVVAILGICVTLSALSLGGASSPQARRCAMRIDGMLTQTRTASMSRAGEVYLELYSAEDGVYCVYTEIRDGVPDSKQDKLCGPRLSVSYIVNETERPLGDEANPLRIAFRREDGALAGDSPCTGITVTGGGVPYTVVIYPSTGSHALGGVA